MLSNDVQTSLLCPGCGIRGKKVGLVTLQALLKPELREHIGPGPYRFCDSPGCDTVYYAEDGSGSFSKPELTVTVGLKETRAPRLLCYCFGHAAEEIDDEVQRTGSTTVAERIATSLRSGCWCETMNPQGSCCLGVVQRYIKEALERFGQQEDRATEHEISDCCASGADHSNAGSGRPLSMGGNP